jgi:hypothetical protein
MITVKIIPKTTWKAASRMDRDFGQDKSEQDPKAQIPDCRNDDNGDQCGQDDDYTRSNRW